MRRSFWGFAPGRSGAGPSATRRTGATGFVTVGCRVRRTQIEGPEEVPQALGAGALAGDAAALGRRQPRVGRGPALGLDRDDGRRDERALPNAPLRGGGGLEQLPGRSGDDRGQRHVLLAASQPWKRSASSRSLCSKALAIGSTSAPVNPRDFATCRQFIVFWANLATVTRATAASSSK